VVEEANGKENRNDEQWGSGDKNRCECTKERLLGIEETEINHEYK
jgi:hypothetical protein